MKIPITDRFLWDIYNILDKADDAAHFILRRRQTLYDVLHERNPVLDKYRKITNRQQFSKLVSHLKKKNLIKVKNLKGNMAVMLTSRGAAQAMKARFKIEHNQTKTKRKDGKWIMIIFDIPKRDERKRGTLRSVLQNLGYKVFQKSVWITPYDVFEKTEELLQFYSLDKYVRIFVVEQVE